MSWTSIVRVWSGMGSEEVISLALLQDVARDDQLLDLAGALVDAQRTHLPVQALDRRAAHHALSAMDLHGPVHHALTRLVSEGLLSVKSRRGYFVTPLTESTLEEGYDVRLALELQAAESAIGRVGRDGLRRFREQHESTAEAVSLPTRRTTPS